MTANEGIEICQTTEEKAFQNIEAICGEWKQYGMTLPLVERAINDKDAAGIQHAICACYVPFDKGDLEVVWPDSDIDRHFTAIRRQLGIIRKVWSLKEKAIALEA